MQKYLIAISYILLFTLSGCKLKDDAVKTVEEGIEAGKNFYEETKETLQRGKKPEIEHQGDQAILSTVISPECAANQVPKYIYFNTQAEASRNIFRAIKNLYSYPPHTLKPLWDSRYVNPVSEYIKGADGSHYANHATLTGLDARTGIRNIVVGSGASQVDPAGVVLQSECIKGKIVAGTTVNLNDAPTQSITYAGPQSTFVYHIDKASHIYPWKKDKTGNLMIQAYFDDPIYINYENNIGGSVSYVLFLYNKRLKKHLNYIIGVYASGVAWQKEKAGIRFDPTTNIIHVATVAKRTSWWSELSLDSQSIKEIKSDTSAKNKDNGKWNALYRVNIAYQNLLQVLQELKNNPPASIAGQDFGLTPEDWQVTLAGIQYEVAEEGGSALLSGSFSGFNVAISRHAF